MKIFIICVFLCVVYFFVARRIMSIMFYNIWEDIYKKEGEQQKENIEALKRRVFKDFGLDEKDLKLFCEPDIHIKVENKKDFFKYNKNSFFQNDKQKCLDAKNILTLKNSVRNCIFDLMQDNPFKEYDLYTYVEDDLYDVIYEMDKYKKTFRINIDLLSSTGKVLKSRIVKVKEKKIDTILKKLNKA